MTNIFKNIKRLYNLYFQRKPLVRRIVLAIGVYMVILLAMLVVIIPPEINISIGQNSPRTVYAPQDIEDVLATQQARDVAAQSVPDAYSRNRQLESQVLGDLKGIGDILILNQGQQISEIEAAIVDGTESGASVVGSFNDSIYNHINTISPDYLAKLNSAAEQVLQEIYEEGIRNKDSGLALMAYKIKALDGSLADHIYLEALLAAIYQPSYTFNSELTSTLKDEAKAAVPPVMVRKGDIIVLENQVISNQTFALIENAGLMGTERRTQMVLGVALYLLMIEIMTIAVLRNFCQEVYDHFKSLSMIALSIVLAVVPTLFLVNYSPYLVLSVMMGVLITVLLSWQVALVATVAIILTVAPILEMEAIIVAFVGSVVAIYGSNHMKQRSDMGRIALYVAAANSVVILSLRMIGGVPLNISLLNALEAVVVGIGLVVMAMGSLPFFENVFGMLSTVRLLELSNPNRPLLHRLLTEAPGTYNHSMVMGNLAEVAAEAVGANPLLARVGAYYHDIGKIKRPGMFSENQINQEESPHEKYPPSLSTLIITSHVRDGVEMAKEENLPKPVIDMIEQHHGTTLVRYFYHKATEQLGENDDPLLESDFSYAGPRPQTKEAGIIMITDAVEATVRSLPRKSTAKVKEIVHKLIKERLNAGEFDECDLTLRDLDKLAETYIKGFTGVYHNRIAYPERSIADLERSRKLGRNRN